MSGQAGGRGYLIQALVSILDALANDSKWTSITLEPTLSLDKVDILWQYPARRKVVQVKSSQHTISLPDVKTWAQELEASITADEYEIRLIGPVSQGVTTLVSHGKVQVPNPQPLDLNGLVYQAAHQLDHYLQSRQLGVQHPSMREMAVQALVTRLSVFSTSGTPLERAAFDALLKSWIGKIAENTVLPPTGWSHTLPDEFKPLVRLDLTTPPPISQHVARSPDGQFWLVHWDSPNRLFRWDKITEDYAANALQHVARYRNVSDWRDLFRE